MSTLFTPDLPAISFSYNWNNKLHCRMFTTLRLANPAKYRYNQQYAIFLKEAYLFPAVIHAINEFRLDQINAFIAGVDTGYTMFECQNIIRKMYPRVDFSTQRLCLLLLENVEFKKPK